MFAYAREELRTIALGRGPRDVARILALLGHLHLRVGRLRRLTGVLPPPRPRTVSIRTRNGLDLRLRTSDGVVLVELLIDPYGVDFARAEPVSRVLDIGANVGLATLALSRHLPGANFACVEPSPDSFELLEQNLRLNCPRARALNVAVVARSGERKEVVEGHFPGVSRTVSSAAGVPGLTVPELLDRVGFARADVMKIDIEGGEREIFAAADLWAGRVGAIVGELHPPLTVAAAMAMLAPHGFEHVPLPPIPRFSDTFYAVSR